MQVADTCQLIGTLLIMLKGPFSCRCYVACLLIASRADAMQVITTYQLIGKFLMLKGPDDAGTTVQTVEHCDRFWYWLKEMGIDSHRSGIVNAIAEKCNTWLPGLYHGELYGA